ncbi:MAG: 4Fe-4S binding protein [Desulforegulaceae bacterium]|nr:4Fe-4S binding protein [Desulforegulaceae bacterium]
MADLYEALRKRLDSMSTGYPVTKSKQEIAILKSLFSENEAKLFLDMTVFPETPVQAGERLGKNPAELEQELEAMAKKGLLMRVRSKGNVMYSILPFLVGIMEFQVKRLEHDKELAKQIAVYGIEGFFQSLQSLETPHQRTVPVHRDLVEKWPVAPFDDVISILEKQKRIAVAPCVCRTMTKSLGIQKCGKPVETCMMFGKGADYYVENKMGRYISLDEAFSIIKRSDDAGLVLQPLNAKDAGAVCSCCGDCCGMMLSTKMQPKPSLMTRSSYFAVVNNEECIGCGLCTERCQMEAVNIIDEKAVIDLDRCIGCGLCVTKCPTDAVSLEKKKDEDLYDPPQNHMAMFMRMARDRGLLQKR